MAHHQANLQDALNRLLKGEHQVLTDSAISAAFPQTIIHLIDHDKGQAAARLLQQVILGSRVIDKDIRRVSAGCLVQTAVKLADAAKWDYLEKLTPNLKVISDSPAYSDTIRSSAGRALQMTRDRLNGKASPVPAVQPQNQLAIREQQIFQLAEKGNMEVAKKQLFDLVVACARKKDFTNAERLRERIYEIDPMALMEIIQSGDIIEEEKSGSVNKDHMAIWSNHLKSLTSEEFNALYHEMEEQSYEQEEIIVEQGAGNDELFFINSGSVRATYQGGQKELFLKNLGSGEIAGENFFNASVWTVSLTARQPASISVLKRERLAALEQRMPGLESKLIDFYNRHSDIASELQKKGMDRRTHDRFKLERKIQLQIVDDKDRILSSFRGVLTDISQGGLSFYVRITKKENSRLLLGRLIKVFISVPDLKERIIRGTVIGVQVFDLIHSEYSVHVKFAMEMPRSDLQTIVE